MQVIVYPTDTDTVAVVYPAPDMDIDAIAAKDVPAGKPFRIIDVDDLPPADEWVWSDNGPIIAAPPSPTPVPASITFAQMLIGLVAEGWITEAEGEAWLMGTPPGGVLALIATLPTEQQFAAKARAIRPSEVLRADPLVQALGAAQGKTSEQLDDFFRTYAQV